MMKKASTLAPCLLLQGVRARYKDRQQGYLGLQALNRAKVCQWLAAILLSSCLPAAKEWRATALPGIALAAWRPEVLEG